jgi:hypothetical protein
MEPGRNFLLKKGTVFYSVSVDDDISNPTRHLYFTSAAEALASLLRDQPRIDEYTRFIDSQLDLKKYRLGKEIEQIYVNAFYLNEDIKIHPASPNNPVIGVLNRNTTLEAIKVAIDQGCPLESKIKVAGGLSPGATETSDGYALIYYANRGFRSLESMVPGVKADQVNLEGRLTAYAFCRDNLLANVQSSVVSKQSFFEATTGVILDWISSPEVIALQTSTGETIKATRAPTLMSLNVFIQKLSDFLVEHPERVMQLIPIKPDVAGYVTSTLSPVSTLPTPAMSPEVYVPQSGPRLFPSQPTFSPGGTTAIDNFAMLPKDVVTFMALNMDLASISNSCQTSKIFRETICDNQNFWAQKVEKEFTLYHTNAQGKKEVFRNPRDFKPANMTWYRYYRELSGKIPWNEALDFSELPQNTKDDIMALPMAQKRDRINEIRREAGLGAITAPMFEPNAPVRRGLMPAFEQAAMPEIRNPFQQVMRPDRNVVDVEVPPFEDPINEEHIRYLADMQHRFLILLNQGSNRRRLEETFEGYQIFQGRLVTPAVSALLLERDLGAINRLADQGIGQFVTIPMQQWPLLQHLLRLTLSLFGPVRTDDRIALNDILNSVNRMERVFQRQPDALNRLLIFFYTDYDLLGMAVGVRNRALARQALAQHIQAATTSRLTGDNGVFTPFLFLEHGNSILERFDMTPEPDLNMLMQQIIERRRLGAQQPLGPNDLVDAEMDDIEEPANNVMRPPVENPEGNVNFQQNAGQIAGIGRLQIKLREFSNLLLAGVNIRRLRNAFDGYYFDYGRQFNKEESRERFFEDLHAMDRLREEGEPRFQTVPVGDEAVLLRRLFGLYKPRGTRYPASPEELVFGRLLVFAIRMESRIFPLGANRLDRAHPFDTVYRIYDDRGHAVGVRNRNDAMNELLGQLAAIQAYRIVGPRDQLALFRNPEQRESILNLFNRMDVVERAQDGEEREGI